MRLASTPTAPELGYFGRRLHTSPCFRNYPSWDPVEADPFAKFEHNAAHALTFALTANVPTFAQAVVGIEGYSFGSQGFHFKVGEATGILIYKLRKEMLVETVVIRIPPSQVKKAATGSGSASKEIMVDSFKEKTGIDLMAEFKLSKVKNPITDVADAYHVMNATRASLGAPE